MNVKDRKYFESVIASSALLSRDTVTLDDGADFSPDSNKQARNAGEGWDHLRWGRVIKQVQEDVAFEEVSSVCVVATISRTIAGHLNIELPLNSGGKMIRSRVSKPFTEKNVRKAHFTRVSKSGKPEDIWRLTAISPVKGGTGDEGVTIDEMSLVFSSGERLSLSKQKEHVFPLFEGDPAFRASNGSFDIDLMVKLNTVEFEPNMVVFRSATGDRLEQRSRLAFRSDSRDGEQNVHTYEDTIRTHPRSGTNYAMVEAITRESLLNAEAPVSSSYWGIPYVVR